MGKKLVATTGEKLVRDMMFGRGNALLRILGWITREEGGYYINGIGWRGEISAPELVLSDRYEARRFRVTLRCQIEGLLPGAVEEECEWEFMSDALDVYPDHPNLPSTWHGFIRRDMSTKFAWAIAKRIGENYKRHFAHDKVVRQYGNARPYFQQTTRWGAVQYGRDGMRNHFALVNSRTSLEVVLRSGDLSAGTKRDGERTYTKQVAFPASVDMYVFEIHRAIRAVEFHVSGMKKPASATIYKEWKWMNQEEFAMAYWEDHARRHRRRGRA